MKPTNYQLQRIYIKKARKKKKEERNELKNSKKIFQ